MSEEQKPASTKIEVRLQASGDAPIMKQKKYMVDKDRKVQWILYFIRKYLKMGEDEALFVYVNQAFSPSPDRTVDELCQCYGSDGKLCLYYAKTQMWG